MTTPSPSEIKLSNPGKVLFPEAGVTKADLAAYYESVAEVALPHMRDRPVSMQVFPRGVKAPGYFAKEVPKGFPDWVDRATVQKRDGEVTHVLAQNAATLVLLAQHNCVTPHVWTSRADQLDRPDRLVIDLDPSGGDDEFPAVRSAAQLFGELVRSVGLEPWAMTTGSRGVHVVAPLLRECSFEEVDELAGKLADAAAAARPDELTTKFRKADRGGRIYLDIARNRWAQTVPPPYAVRARPDAPVAMPLQWEELSDDTLSSRDWNVGNVADRLADGGDRWAAIGDSAASPRSALKRAAEL